MNIKSAKAIYVSYYWKQYPKVLSSTIGLYGKDIKKQLIGYPDKTFEHIIPPFVEAYVYGHINHSEIKAKFKRKRKKMRKMFAIPKGQEIPFQQIVAMEKLYELNF